MRYEELTWEFLNDSKWPQVSWELFNVVAIKLGINFISNHLTCLTVQYYARDVMMP